MSLQSYANYFFSDQPTDSGVLQVLRWSALGLGVFYGVYRQASLSSAAKLAAIDREYQHKQSLIEMAKVEYTKKNLPPSEKKEGGDSMLDPVFSLAFPETKHSRIRSNEVLDTGMNKG